MSSQSIFREPSLFLSSGTENDASDQNDKNRDGSQDIGLLIFQPPVVGANPRKFH